MAARFAATKVLPLWKSGSQEYRLAIPSALCCKLQISPYDSQLPAELLFRFGIISEGVSDVGKSQ
jgi:hypothetical protein